MQNISAMLFLCIIPIILILLFVYHKDKKKEPIFLLLVLFCLGIVSCFLVLKVVDLLKLVFPFMNMTIKEMDLINLILYAFFGVALVEELCKWIMVFTVGYHNKEFEETYDILIYAVFVALGFAFFENIGYVFSYMGNVKTAFLRAISAVPGHACYAISMGYYLSIAKQCSLKKRKDLERNNIILSIIIPTVFHGIYDFCAMSGYKGFVYVFIVFVIYLYIVTIKKLKEISATNQEIRKEKQFCPKCGYKVDSNKFCNHCGTRV